MQQSAFAPILGGNILIRQQSINPPQSLAMPLISNFNNVAAFNSAQIPTQMKPVFVNNTPLCIQQKTTGQQQLMCSPAISAIQIPIQSQQQQQQPLFVTNVNGQILGIIALQNNYLGNNQTVPSLSCNNLSMDMPLRIDRNISLNNNIINFAAAIPPIPNFTLPDLPHSNATFIANTNHNINAPVTNFQRQTPIQNEPDKKNEPVTKKVFKADKKFVCEVCGKKYKYLCNYKSHFKIHTDDCYKCQFCGKKFGRKSNYTEHVRVHTGESPFKCTYCDKRFKQRHGWKDHLRVHTGEKPYQCNICQRRFSVGHNLNVHKRIHTGEKPFKCKLCPKAYRQKTAYNSHIKTTH